MAVMVDPKLLKESALLQDLEAGVIEEMARVMRRVTYDPGELIIREAVTPWALWIMRSGFIRILYGSAEGLEMVVKYFRSPAVFGDMEFLAGVPYFCSLEAIEKTELLVLDIEQYQHFTKRSPRFMHNLYRDMAHRFAICAFNERALAFNSVEKRLASLLVTLAKYEGRRTAQGREIRVPLSQEELARALGVNRRSITRALREWTGEDLISKRGRYFTVRSMRGLLRYGDPELIGLSYHFGMRLRRLEDDLTNS